MGFTNHSLDMWATKLSEFTKPVIPELALKDDKTLQNHLLESVLGILGGEHNAHARHLVTNIVRRVFASMEMYRLGRANALDYVAGDRHNNVVPYFKSLTFFETCLGYCWQICDCLNELGNGDKVFQKGDGSAWERLHGIYTYGTKHPIGSYDDITKPEMPTAIWLTNDGIECINGMSVTFEELNEIIALQNDLFYALQKMIRDKYEKKKPDAA